MLDEASRAAYSDRAAEYIELLGSMGSVHPSDLQLVSSWAGDIDGHVIDAGCGPGHWTNFLADLGLYARGMDMVPEFVAHARRTYPSVDFTLGSLETLNAVADSLGGIFSWFSLIHHKPEAIRIPLTEFSRALKPGGRLLVGFFEGPVIEEFAHAVTPAYRWPVDNLIVELSATGFDVIESRVRKTTGQRSQAAITARRRDDH